MPTNPKNIMREMLGDLAVMLGDAFDRNFETKSFFGTKWAATKWNNPKGTLMARTGTLRRSIRRQVRGNSIIFSSNVRYAQIHNVGGKIKVTAQMLKFFYARYKEASGNVNVRLKSGALSMRAQRNVRYSTEANFWKSMIAKSIGSYISIPRRQFVGWHDSLQPRVRRVVEQNVKRFFEQKAKDIATRRR